MRPAPVLLVALLLAGCFKGGGDAPDAVVAPAAANGSPSFALPEDRGVSAAANETNATEAGVGGRAHKHDDWQGREQVVLFQDTVDFAPFPVFPEGPGTSPRSVAYVRLPRGSLVHEGAEKLVVLARMPTIRGQASPAPPSLTLQHRTAADSAWRAPQPLLYDQPLEIPVAPLETDMPHSTASLWAFRLLMDHPSPNGLNLTITAFKGRDVADWPGHPDFYPDGRTERVLLDKDATNHKVGGADLFLYERGDAWVTPDKLVSYGTGWLDVFVNVTGAQGPPGLKPVSYWIAYHNATSLAITCCDWDYAHEADGRNDLRSYRFRVPVDPAGMDGPYQPQSRWGIRVEAGWGVPDTPASGAFGCGDCVSYDVSYHVTVIAHKAETSDPPSP